LACLTMAAEHYGRRLDLGALRRRYPLSSRGASLKALMGIADELGFHSRPLRAELHALGQLQTPAILHWDLNHFVLLLGISKGATPKYRIADPAVGVRVLEADEVSKHFTGVVLEVAPSEAFVRGDSRAKLHLSQLWTRIRGLGPALSRILILSIVIQLVTLASPFYMQLAIDSAVPSSDFDLLTVLALGFAGLMVLNQLSSWVRSWLLISLSNSLALQTAVNLFRHTIYLPISWFEKRHLGDVVSRFTSLQPITDLLSRGLVAALVDGVLAMATLCLMVIYSPILASLAAGVVLAYAGLKFGFYNMMKLNSANLLTAQALETSSFIENVRGIAAIKVFCQEGNRQRIWQNRKSDVVNATVKMGRLSAGFDAANAALVGLETIAFVYIGARMAIAGNITLGMLFAYQAYKQNFVGAATRLIDQVMSYRLLDVHLDRISDIAFAQPEPNDGLERSDSESGPPLIELRNVSFRYGRGLPLILDNVSIEIPAGTSTALVGPSGAGKTTLMKILCGLLEPTSGGLYVNGAPLAQYGVRRYRNQIGVVSQSDTLFAGSLAENVSFFDSDYDFDWVQACCRQAAIHGDIAAMAMRYETPVGDMGSNLSGGQMQRILLARALYKKPEVLFLDEGTAHLDLDTEARVAASIRALGISRVIVAHRPETIRYADRLFRVLDGRVEPVVLQPRPLVAADGPAE